MGGPRAPAHGLLIVKPARRALLHARATAGLTQVELAARAGVARSLVAMIEGGRRGLTAPVAEKLARVLDVPPELLR